MIRRRRRYVADAVDELGTFLPELTEVIGEMTVLMKSIADELDLDEERSNGKL